MKGCGVVLVISLEFCTNPMLKYTPAYLWAYNIYTVPHVKRNRFWDGEIRHSYIKIKLGRQKSGNLRGHWIKFSHGCDSKDYYFWGTSLCGLRQKSSHYFSQEHIASIFTVGMSTKYAARETYEASSQNMGADSFSETSVNFSLDPWRYIPEFSVLHWQVAIVSQSTTCAHNFTFCGISINILLAFKAEVYCPNIFLTSKRNVAPRDLKLPYNKTLSFLLYDFLYRLYVWLR
jgi:hypothetical protein